MKKYGGQKNIPKDYFPGDSEDFKIEGPSDSFSPQDNSGEVNNSLNNTNSVNMQSIIKSNNNKFNVQDSEESNKNKFKDDYKPKRKRNDNDEDDELEAMLSQTKMKQNKLQEKSIEINPSQFQLQDDSKNKKENNVKEKQEKNNQIKYKNQVQRYDDLINLQVIWIMLIIKIIQIPVHL